MVSSSLINYKVPEFYRRISIWDTSSTRSESTPSSRLFREFSASGDAVTEASDYSVQCIGRHRAM